MPRRFTEEEKAHILARAAEIGTAAAAKEAGVHYNSVLKWASSVKAVKKSVEMPGDLVERLSSQIALKGEEVEALEEALKGKKAELKTLLKARQKAEKEKELLDAAEKKKKLVEAVMNSGKSVDEIMAFLNR